MAEGLIDPSVIVNNSLANPWGTGFNNGAAFGDRLKANDIAQQKEQDFAALAQNHSPKQILAMQLKYPELTAHIKTAFDQMDVGEQKRRVEQTIPIYAAALNGRMDIAKKKLQEQKTALENSGGTSEEIANIQNHIDLADSDPTAFKNEAALSLSHGMGADKFGSTFVDLGKAENEAALAPYKQYSEQAKGNKDQAAAARDNAILPYAAPTAEAELINKQNEPSNTAFDNNVNMMNAQNGQNMNLLKQQELQQNMGFKQQEIGQKQIEASKAYEGSVSKIAQLKDRISEVLKDPILKAAPWQRNKLFESVPGSPYKTFAHKLDTIQLKQLIPTIAEAKANGWAGSMSNVDIENLKNEIDSLDTSLDSKELESHLKKIDTILGMGVARDMKYGRKLEKVGGLLPGTVDNVSKTYPQSQQPPAAPQGVDPEQWAQFLQERGGQ